MTVRGDGAEAVAPVELYDPIPVIDTEGAPGRHLEQAAQQLGPDATAPGGCGYGDRQLRCVVVDVAVAGIVAADETDPGRTQRTGLVGRNPACVTGCRAEAAGIPTDVGTVDHGPVQGWITRRNKQREVQHVEEKRLVGGDGGAIDDGHSRRR